MEIGDSDSGDMDFILINEVYWVMFDIVEDD